MKNKKMLFELSWEIGSVTGGVRAILASKVQKMMEIYGENYVLIGPDLTKNKALEGVFEEEVWDPEALKHLEALDKVSVRMGRWMVHGRPKCLLVRFEALFADKDPILAGYWERFGLNSLFGNFEYIEPVIFSQAAARVVECIFYSSLFHEETRTIVQCHDWSAGSAILYLKEKTPEIGTIFTTHSTTLGKTLASRGVNYEALAQYASLDTSHLAHEHDVVAKHSLETIVARVTDVFTTVSESTARECELLLNRRPDFITMSGIGDHTVDPEFLKPEAVTHARLQLLNVANYVTGEHYDPEMCTILVHSGRYEFINKGIDLILDSMSRVNQRLMEEPGYDRRRHIILFLMTPAQHGPLREPFQRAVTTHRLADELHDPILTRMSALNLRNWPEASVHVIFIPTQLNGQDRDKNTLLTESYDQLLPAMDLSLFPSFYEPWGYGPLESLAFGVPTITSDLSGFGIWAQKWGAWNESGVHVLRRRGVRFETAKDSLSDKILEFHRMSPEERSNLSKATASTVERGKWNQFGEAYEKAHSMALSKVRDRLQSDSYDRFRVFSQGQVRSPFEGVTEAAHTRKFKVVNVLPPIFETLKSVIEKNLWWFWSHGVSSLFESLDGDLWVRCRKDPIAFLERVKVDTLQKAAASEDYVERIEKILKSYNKLTQNAESPRVAYFCMEYGISHLLKNYSGGLGILAGDHLKSASDMNIPLCAFGLAYRFGYFKQKISGEGRQEVVNETNNFLNHPWSPVMNEEGERLRFPIEAPGATVWIQAWKISVGRISLYLLDTDLIENTPEDRMITDRLYGGNSDHRLRQEYILALGGYELIRQLNLKIRVYHMNEGHTAFLVLCRIHKYMSEEKMSFDEAFELVRHSMVFTTHTPVPAGHDVFNVDMVRSYLQAFESSLGVGRCYDLARGIEKGRENVFSMTGLAARGSLFLNGVSQIHAEVSKKMFHSLVPRIHYSEVPVRGITNGVHPATWICSDYQEFFSSHLSKDWKTHFLQTDYWEKLKSISAEEFWNVHMSAKRRLISWLRGHLQTTWPARRENPAALARAMANVNESALIATYARRFAPYKRAHLLFKDPHRLGKLLSGPKPMVLLFAGKAHPHDKMGQDLIEKVMEFSRRPEFAGKIIFVENYEIDVAQLLVSGSDIWINNPLRPLEASGTSGMKAAMNGCLNLSVPDGWWAEAANGKNGWSIGTADMQDPSESQDMFDSERIYTLLEQEVLPLFQNQNAANVPEKWVEMMKESIITVLTGFNTERMLRDYKEYCYLPAMNSVEELRANQDMKLKQLVESRARLKRDWKRIEFDKIEVQGIEGPEVNLGSKLCVNVLVKHPGLEETDFQVEAILAEDQNHTHPQVHPQVCLERGSGESRWEVCLELNQVGSQMLGVRVTPRPCHREHVFDLTMDYVKWL